MQDLPYPTLPYPLSPRARAQRGEPDLAQPLYEHALAVYEAALGPDHAEVAHTLTDLAVLHLEQARGPCAPARPRPGARGQCKLCVTHTRLLKHLPRLGVTEEPSAPASCISRVGLLCGVLRTVTLCTQCASAANSGKGSSRPRAQALAA
jgi:hypothetical protein